LDQSKKRPKGTQAGSTTGRAGQGRAGQGITGEQSSNITGKVYCYYTSRKHHRQGRGGQGRAGQGRTE